MNYFLKEGLETVWIERGSKAWNSEAEDIVSKDLECTKEEYN